MSYFSISFKIWVGKKDPFFEAIVLNTDRYEYYFANKAVEYCRKVLNSPWPAAEDVIRESSLASYRYARFVLNERWRKGEKAILKDVNSSYLYSRFVLKDRWKPAEEKMSHFVLESYWYAKNVLNDRFKIAEKRISNSSYAALYAKNVLKNRWKSAEESILSNSSLSSLNGYIEMLRGKDRVDFHNKIIALGIANNDNGWCLPVHKRWLDIYGDKFVRNKV